MSKPQSVKPPLGLLVKLQYVLKSRAQKTDTQYQKFGGMMQFTMRRLYQYLDYFIETSKFIKRDTERVQNVNNYIAALSTEKMYTRCKNERLYMKTIMYMYMKRTKLV